MARRSRDREVHPRDVVEGLDAGGDDYLTKPIDHAALLARVRSMLRIKSPTTPSWTRPELAEWSHQLERRVADQLGQIAKMERLRRFLPPQVADLMMSGGAADPLPEPPARRHHRVRGPARLHELRRDGRAREVIAVVREYHACVGELVFRYEGTLERFVGDECWSSSTIRSRRRITRSARFGWRSNCGSR